MDPASRHNLLDLIKSERAETDSKPMTDPELSAAIDQRNRLENRRFAVRAIKRQAQLPALASMAYPGPEPVTTYLRVLEVRRALAFREVVNLDNLIGIQRRAEMQTSQQRASRCRA